MSDEGAESDHRGTKRVRRACLNCRRKKTRCPGEFPECSFCARLGQTCQYSDPATRKSQSSAGLTKTISNDPQYEELMDRISQLEQKLGSLSASRDDSSSNVATTAVMSGPAYWQPADSPPNWTQNHYMSPSQNLGSLCQESFKLPPPDHTQSALDDFFLHSHNQPYSFFNELDFRIRLADGRLPDYLVFAVFATAARFSYKANKDAIARDYAQNSWRLLSIHMESDEELDVSVVQATTLLAIFDFTACRNRTAWRKIGIAARLAQDLKLMFEPDSSLPYVEQEERRRSYWSIYLLDCLVTCGRARPPVFQDHFCKLNLPSTEYVFHNGEAEATGSIDQFLQDKNIHGKNPAPFAKVIVIATILGRCTRYALQDVNIGSERPPWDRTSDYAAVQSTLLDLEAHFEFRRPVKETIEHDCMMEGHLDQHSAEPVVFAYALYYLCQCLLNHHFLLRRRLEPYAAKVPLTFFSQASEACRSNARDLTRLLQDAPSLGCTAHSSFFGYCSLVAGTINSLHQFSQTPEIQEESRDGLQMNINFLTAHSKYWDNAHPMLDTLQRFSQDASSFHDLIDPSIAKIDFSTTDIERLYNLVDYSVVSKHQEPIDHAFNRATLTTTNPEIIPWLFSEAENGEHQQQQQLLFGGGAGMTTSAATTTTSSQQQQQQPLTSKQAKSAQEIAQNGEEYMGAMSSHFVLDPTMGSEYLEMMSQYHQPNSNVYANHML